MFSRIGRPSPATVIALFALFVALSGTAVAAGVVPLAKRALVADNAQKLQGKTAMQIAAAPSPASNANRSHSQRTGRKLIDVASAVVESHLLLLAPASPSAVGDVDTA